MKPKMKGFERKSALWWRWDSLIQSWNQPIDTWRLSKR